jgi:hypothetical protein
MSLATIVRKEEVQPETITMPGAHRKQIANRIHLALMRELGQGIDVKQMLHSALYARDVLLVCQAYPGSELQRLGTEFRLAGIEAGPHDEPRPSGWRRDSSGFGLSSPAASGGASSFDGFIDSAHDARQATRRWLLPSTWFGR